MLLPIIKKYFVLFNNGYIKNDYINDLVYITGSKGNIDVYSYPELICGNIVKIKSDINISNVTFEGVHSEEIQSEHVSNLKRN